MLKNVQEQYGERVVLISVSLDENEEALREHLETYSLSWPTLFEEGTGWANPIARQYGITAIPSIWVIDPEGRVAALKIWDEQLQAKLMELLGPSEKSTEG